MNTLETLYFPDTTITPTRQFPLLLLFSAVHFIQPVEPDETSAEQSKDTFMDSQFCQGHTPHPLGKDRDRFLYLINDIKNRKDDYAAQLSHITLASMSGTKAKGDSSKQEIMSSLLGRGSSTTSKSSNDEELEALWHARLILKIAEILDREEAEVAEALVQLEDNETDLFAKLKGTDTDEGDEDNIYQELDKIKSKMTKPRTESIQNRMRAWFRLTENADIPRCQIWTTCRQETAEILFENYEKKKDSLPTLLTKLELPDNRMGRNLEQVMEKLLDFREESKELFSNLSDKLSSATAELTNDQAQDFSKISSDWHQLLNLHFPANDFGRTAILFYYFEDQLFNFIGSKTDQNNPDSSILAVYAS